MIRQRRQRWTAGLVIGALMVGSAAAADADGARAQLEQRLKLAASLMSDSATAQRIRSSGNAAAVSHLDEGRLYHALANDLMAKGDLEGARKAADDALRNLGLARRLVPDAPAQQSAARQRFGELDAAIDRLIAAWRQRSGAAEAQDADLLAAVSMVATARGLAQDGRYTEAVRTLTTAEGHVLAGMNRVLHARTIDYTNRASTPAEEFQLELARHQSLSELVPLAVDDLKPKADARALIERYVETSNGLRQQAQERFQSGDVEQALDKLRSATQFVQRALLSAGLVVPQPTGN